MNRRERWSGGRGRGTHRDVQAVHPDPGTGRARLVVALLFLADLNSVCIRQPGTPYW
ncbi:hypothetical protein XFF6166_590079 [Xanthomonas citri pv. fuscans]|nr:hypothetical protein XFF6166_590079 [Xanthomonas citri pv. fuscans]SOO00787.1 hypothetical protein XFF6960_370078 [Xanthomonas citri pv. fuscans]SOO06443.1 hypothetical protein XFF7767_700079 [Xanthomonas citri pv. fuscans]SOO10994.1 hypothetical protein XFF6970_690057 [Xanthomonas citri pv. fuscans]SOO15472.1 hypothetical protein XFF7766_570056 [Xanthomonas citri pv. fuscans]